MSLTARQDTIRAKVETLGKPLLSFEFFPPKTTEGQQKLKDDIPAFAALKPEYISVTYGAGGSTQEATYDIVKYIKEKTSVPPVAHLTCVNATREFINNVAMQYLQMGVNRIVALRGDVPGMKGPYVPHPEGYAYADDLVKGLAALGNFRMSVAAYPEVHPQARSAEDDLAHVKRKLDAGAAEAITQYCFDTQTVLDFIAKAKAIGVTKPIVPGVLLINNFKQSVSFSQRCGASVPAWIHDEFSGLEPNSPEHLQKAAVIAAEQCVALMETGIDHFHLYTLNRLDVTQEVCKLLGVTA